MGTRPIVHVILPDRILYSHGDRLIEIYVGDRTNLGHRVLMTVDRDRTVSLSRFESREEAETWIQELQQSPGFKIAGEVRGTGS